MIQVQIIPIKQVADKLLQIQILNLYTVTWNRMDIIKRDYKLKILYRHYVSVPTGILNPVGNCIISLYNILA